MSRTGRNTLVVALVAALVALFALTAVAASEGGEDEGGDTVTSTTIDSGLTPAVELGGDEPTEAQADWTYRYIVPTVLVLAGVVIVLTAVKYFTDVVRRRYRIVEE